MDDCSRWFIYKIINGANGLCLDNGGSTTDGSAMQQWGSGSSLNQQWNFTSASTGGSAPTITSVTAGTVPAGTASGTVGTIFSYTITATGSPTSYNATGLPSGLSANTGNGVISGTPTASGTFSVTLSAINATATGQATLTVTIAPSVVTVANGTYKIINRNSGQALDVVGSNNANGAAIDQWPYSGANNQRWTVTNLGGGKYKIIGVASGRSLDISGGYGNLEIWDYNGGVNQQWIFAATSGGYYYITSGDLGSQFGLEVPGSSMSNGTLLDMWSINGGNNQQWILQAP
jgi:Ricin-type beta-trefoil lectin domain-like/Putative Ig domain